jgi:succinate dehydrogenase / fumarate reductase cytochrome b subunit
MKGPPVSTATVSNPSSVKADPATSARACLLGGHAHFLFRRLHSLSGIVFGGYIVIHLLVNATLVEGARVLGEPTVFQMQVDKIHSLPFLLAVEWAFIYLPIIYHTLYGLLITFTGQPNALSYPYAKNWFYFFQRASAIVIALFIAFHVLAMKGVFGGDLGRQLTFDPARATQSAARHMHAVWWIGFVVYPLGILASCYHLANGFWAAAITWGLTVSKAAQRRWGYVCSGLFVLTLVCGILALVSALRQPVANSSTTIVMAHAAAAYALR